METLIVFIRKIITLLLLLLINYVFTFGQKTIDITYIANEGFIISGENDKILIDGIFTQGWGKYHTPSQQTLILEHKALSPFDNLSVILISHYHADHINTDYVVEHMVNDNNPVLICPLQVNNLLALSKDYNTIKGRVVAITPEYIAKIDTIVQKMNFKIISLQHANDDNQEIQNLGFIFSVNGFKIFHPGDALSNNLSAYESLHLTNDSIDIAFLPRWFFDSEYGEKGNVIINYLKPKAIIMMHINTDKLSYYRNAIKTMQGIPYVYLMDLQMGKLRFKKDNKSIITIIDKQR